MSKAYGQRGTEKKTTLQKGESQRPNHFCNPRDALKQNVIMKEKKPCQEPGGATAPIWKHKHHRQEDASVRHADEKGDEEPVSGECK